MIFSFCLKTLNIPQGEKNHAVTIFKCEFIDQITFFLAKNPRKALSIWYQKFEKKGMKQRQ